MKNYIIWYTVGPITDELILTELELKRLLNEKTGDEEVEFTEI